MDTERKKPEITTAILLETRVTNKDGNHPVKLRITFQRKRKYYSIKGEHLSKEEYKKNMVNDQEAQTKQRKRNMKLLKTGLLTL